MKIYSYVLKHDHKFSPNPYWGYCTLACCKPKIRLKANVGDWILGTGSTRHFGSDRLIYAMRVTEKVTMEEYSQDHRFKSKIPGVSGKSKVGDNIYYKKSGKWHQRKSLHSCEHIKTDLSGKYVLISEDFKYFGKKAARIPIRLKKLIKKGPAYKCYFSEKFKDEVLRWISNCKAPHYY